MTLLEKLTEITGEQAIAEKVNSALGEYMIPKGTFNEVNQKLKTVETETNSLRTKLGERDTELEKIRTAGMDDQEKLQHQLDTLKQDLAQRDFENNKLGATSKLSKVGLTEEEIAEIVGVHVTDDKEKSEQAIDMFVRILETKTGAVEQKVKDKIYNQDTKVDDVGTTPQVTGSLTFDKFKEMGWQERNEMFTEQPDVYEKYTQKEKQQ